MDSFREFPSDLELEQSAAQAEPSADAGYAANVAAAIGTDERRMHVRAYNYWVSLLDGRDFPSIEDLEPDDLHDFSGNSVLLDFTCGRDNPAIPYIGGAIREECGLDDDARMISDVPHRSLLSRLTDHYMQIIANRAPVGFEAEFLNPRGDNICYRGILMPFSSDGDGIDFIYGVINWKNDAGDCGNSSVELAAPSFADDPPLSLPARDFAAEEPEIALPAATATADAGLADLLSAARETAEAAKTGEGRTRAALYQALALAYDFALSARANPEDFADLLADSGVTAQARAPMTPVVKLVFGADYDKARLTEYAAALSFADRQSVDCGEFGKFIAGQPGGLKALVAAERKARRPQGATVDAVAAAREKLRAAPALSLDDLGDSGEFALVVVRRSADGGYAPVALVADGVLTERALRRLG
ncbi:MAG: hypothetical protein ABIO68_03230 [Sphingomicrobium sp.]